ncbi:MAG: hypothetical protein AOA65_1905 [Candidatus Bathyarchaeota archaeon BA1]|nr:MAG: hypothetical protein AOA65_1905 [Candidatus Bathyarchaeota archaeon BA1]
MEKWRGKLEEATRLGKELEGLGAGNIGIVDALMLLELSSISDRISWLLGVTGVAIALLVAIAIAVF